MVLGLRIPERGVGKLLSTTQRFGRISPDHDEAGSEWLVLLGFQELPFPTLALK